MPHRWRQVVHCDLKPNNIFLREPRSNDNPLPNIVLGDFGFAVIGEDRSGGGAPRYQPPEYPHNTDASDVWALGATIHQMAHGQVPVKFEMPEGYRGSEREWWCDPKSKQVTPLPCTYSSALNRNMLDCLQMRPDQRVSAYNLLRHIRREAPK